MLDIHGIYLRFQCQARPSGAELPLLRVSQKHHLRSSVEKHHPNRLVNKHKSPVREKMAQPQGTCFSARKPTLIIVHIVAVQFDFQDRFAQIGMNENLHKVIYCKQTSKPTKILNVGLFWQCRDFYVTPVKTTPLANTIQYYIDVT